MGYLATGVEDGSVAFEFVSPGADGSEWQNTNPLVAQAPALAPDFKPSGVAAVKPFQWVAGLLWCCVCTDWLVWSFAQVHELCV